MNARRLMYRLQTALNLRGYRIRINQYQCWSDKSERMVTKYVAATEKINPRTGRPHSVSICESYHAVEIVKALAELLNSDSNAPPGTGSGDI